MTAFADKLAELRERKSRGGFDGCAAENELGAFLANHAEAIEKVVRAAKAVVLADHAYIIETRHDIHALRDALNELEGKG